MMIRTIVGFALVALSAAGTVQKRADEKYGPIATAPVGGASYNSAAAAPSYSPAAPSYSSGGTYSAPPAAYSGTSGTDNGNLYYYYYPVANAQQQQPVYNQYPSYPQPTTANPLLDLFGFGGLDFNSLIIPLLLLGGVLLLLPAMLGCDLSTAVCTIPLPGFGRKKRDIDGVDGPVTLQENIDRAFNLYMAAMEGDVCMKRVMCELGGIVQEVKGKGAFFSLIDNFVPEGMKDNVKALKTGALNDKNKCQVYKCGSKRWLGE